MNFTALLAIERDARAVPKKSTAGERKKRDA